MLRLYYSPGACSLSPHIALREASLPFELRQVDLRAKRTLDGEDYLAINPKGYVPALALDDGQLLTEGAVIVQYIADLVPDVALAPPPGTRERLRLQEWLNFIATELHKGLGPLHHPKANEEYKQAQRERVLTRFTVLERGLAGRTFLLGERFSVADGYAYYVLRGLNRISPATIRHSPVLSDYFARLSARPGIVHALAAEGLA